MSWGALCAKTLAKGNPKFEIRNKLAAKQTENPEIPKLGIRMKLVLNFGFFDHLDLFRSAGPLSDFEIRICILVYVGNSNEADHFQTCSIGSYLDIGSSSVYLFGNTIVFIPSANHSWTPTIVKPPAGARVRLC